MLTFKQFIKENEEYVDPEHIKGWMSPEGKVHLLNSGTEHGHDIHPDIKPQYKGNPNNYEQGVDFSLSKGYTRFGKDGLDSNYVHYNPNIQGGKKSAYHALNYLNPKPIAHHDHIDVLKSKKLYSRKDERKEISTNKRSKAATFILGEIFECLMEENFSANELERLYGHEFKSDTTPPPTSVPNKPTPGKPEPDLEGQYQKEHVIRIAKRFGYEEPSEQKFPTHAHMLVHPKSGHKLIIAHNLNSIDKPAINRIHIGHYDNKNKHLAHILGSELVQHLSKTKFMHQ
jgi:hypothetical protein